MSLIIETDVLMENFYKDKDKKNYSHKTQSNYS